MNWTLKRNDNGQTLELHDQYVWSDELAWSDIARGKPVRLFGGGIDIQEGTKKAGRPITLNGDKASIKRGDLKTLQAWSNVPELTMTLIHPDRRTFNVAFIEPYVSNERALFDKDYKPGDQSDDDKMQATINLLTV